VAPSRYWAWHVGDDGGPALLPAAPGAGRVATVAPRCYGQPGGSHHAGSL
jgi:hypothetical protein